MVVRCLVQSGGKVGGTLEDGISHRIEVLLVATMLPRNGAPGVTGRAPVGANPRHRVGLQSPLPEKVPRFFNLLKMSQVAGRAPDGANRRHLLGAVAPTPEM